MISRDAEGPAAAAAPGEELAARIERREAVVGVLGLGYVGLPLAVEVARSGFRVLGFDISERVVNGINAGESHIQDVEGEVVARFVEGGMLSATRDLSRLAECDAVSICVPTPLNKTKDPDLSYVISAAQAVKHGLRRGQLVILESTTYPGTTREVLLPVFEDGTGLEVGEDFFLCFSPERVDPGNPRWHTRNTPKVIGGVTPACLEAGKALYSHVFDELVPVASAEAAELTKVYENTFRMINIALANELAQACDRLGVDVWEVIDAAATKPFGFMKFTPGPGLGGHCIPLDPHYLSWKMRTLAFRTRMIELASEINSEMPHFVVQKGAEVSYHDAYVPTIADDGHTPLQHLPMHSVPLTDAVLGKCDLALVVTDHGNVDYQRVAELAPLVVDTRGVMRDPPQHVIGLSRRPAPAPPRLRLVQAG